MSDRRPYSPECRIYRDLDELSAAAADVFESVAAGALAAQERCTVALSGGSTPRRLYERLAHEPYRTRVDWSRVHLYWGDERCVPPEHPESNYRLVRESLLAGAPVPAANVHRVAAELADPTEAAALYEAELVRDFGLAPRQMPRFDLVLLGLGADGHTASLFPGSPALEQEQRLAVANLVETLGAQRITLTAPVLSHARNVVFLVAGKDKAPALREVLEGEARPQLYPAQLIRPAAGRLLFLADQPAAALLTRQRPA
jgi:6-phosphogluconolactonase